MNDIITKERFSSPIILAALAAVVVIALGSIMYYISATQVPAAQVSLESTTTPSVTGSGPVQPAQSPDLAFQASGRIVRISAEVGKHVSQGQVLASLDTSTLSAQRASAVAGLKAQEAKLDEMKAGPRGVDVAAKQTAIESAKAALANLYVSINSNIAQAYDKSFSGVSANTDSLFSQANTASPILNFKSSNSQNSADASNLRVQTNNELGTWKGEVNSQNSDTAQTEADLALAIQHLGRVRTYADTLLEALGTAIESSSFPQSSIAAAQASVGSLRDTVNSQIISLQTLQQSVTTNKLAITSASDALNQTNAGATQQAVSAQAAQVEAAQAAIDAIDAQIRNAVIVAPFAGTVSSVHAKIGETELSGVPVISLSPESAQQITVYLTELDIAKIQTGETADVTLDAYGTERHWSATVVSIDTSPTNEPGATGYKTVLQFEQSDPAISSGMTANITISVN